MAEFRFGAASREKLLTCDQRLRTIAIGAIEMTPVDFTIVWGWRPQHIQDALFASGASKKRWPESTHNHMKDGEPSSLALDFGVWVDGKIPWKDTHMFCVVAGVFFAAAKREGITLRWGGDWDMDGSTMDQSLMDWGHVEVLL